METANRKRYNHNQGHEVKPRAYTYCGTCKKCGKFFDVKDALKWEKGSFTGGGISKKEICRACDTMEANDEH